MSGKTLYFDHASATPPSDQVVGRMLPFFSDQWGSPLSPHRAGQRLFPAIEGAYKALYALLKASTTSTVLLTSGGAEGVNQIVQGVYLDQTRLTGKNHFLTTTCAEAPPLMAMRRLEKWGCLVETISGNREGLLTVEALIEALSPRTALLSIPWVNGLTGVIQPVKALSELCKQRGVLLHVDASHALGRLSQGVEELGADFVTAEGSLMGGPKGTGLLWIRAPLSLSPLISGGAAQGGMRGGELFVPGLVGLGVAAQEALDHQDFVSTEVCRLRYQLENGICEQLPFAKVLFSTSRRAPQTSLIAFQGVVNEALLLACHRQGLCASMGGGMFQQIARVVGSYGYSPFIAHGALSFSLGVTTTEKEVEQAIEIVTNCANHLYRIGLHGKIAEYAKTQLEAQREGEDA